MIPHRNRVLDRLKVPLSNGLYISDMRRKESLASIFPASAVFDLDATISDSYTNGQSWKNIVQVPADGAAKSAYDFNLGATNAATTDDPTFVGNAGAPNSYFSLDGGDYFTLAGASTNTPLLNTVHQKISHTLILALNHNNSLSQDIGLFGTCDTAQANDRGIQYYAGWSSSFYRQRTATGLASATRAQTPNTAADRVIIFSYDSVSGNITSYWNSLSGNAVSSAWNTSSDARTGATPVSIGSRGASAKMPNGTKIYSCAMLNIAASASDVSRIIKFYNQRHNRVYV